MMSTRGFNALKVIGLVLLVLVLVGISTAAMPRVKEWLKPDTDQSGSSAKSQIATRWDADHPNTIQLPASVERQLGVRAAEITKATQSRTLDLNGSVAPNTDLLYPVHPRFAGEVEEIGQVPDTDLAQPTRFRDLRNGDRVLKDQLLAVVWSKDLGEKKNELIDALLKRRLDQEVLRRYEDLYSRAAIPERTVRDAQFAVQTDQNAVRKAEATLRSWRLTDEEVRAIYAEADRLAERNRKGDFTPSREDWKRWARVEVRAPFDGVIVEKNVTPRLIVDTTSTLFQILDLSNVSVWAYAYEEDLPALTRLRLPVSWTIHFKNDPQGKVLHGKITEIRPIIDPTVHAALVKGQVKNPEGRLFLGQFFTASVKVPPEPDELVIPTSALVEDGEERVIFVQPEAGRPTYVMRHVEVVRRGQDYVQIKSEVNEKDKGRGLKPLRPGDRVVKASEKDKGRGLKPLRPGDRVVKASALELWAALKDLQEQSPSAAAK
jgi:cobalt-zinc-cadmium efflux system membrane fusion protein